MSCKLSDSRLWTYGWITLQKRCISAYTLLSLHESAEFPRLFPALDITLTKNPGPVANLIKKKSIPSFSKVVFIWLIVRSNIFSSSYKYVHGCVSGKFMFTSTLSIFLLRYVSDFLLTPSRFYVLYTFFNLWRWLCIRATK